MSNTNGGDGRSSVPQETLSDADQTASDADQTVSDLDQTASDADEELANRNQDQANADQAASDRDQAASDLEWQAHPEWPQSSMDAHETSRSERDSSTLARDATAVARAATAQERTDRAARRDHNASLRDLTAGARDLAAEALDRAAVEWEKEQREKFPPDARSVHDRAVEHASAVRERATQVRARGATDRAAAAKDRHAAAQDREESAGDRKQAWDALRLAHVDELTGAYIRGIGLVALQNEVDRARRDDGTLVLAFVDVDGLKAVNDRDGHAAGDALLRAAASAMRSRMRSYEPIVRFGGDEFVCTFGGMSMISVQDRFKEIQGVLDHSPNPGTLAVGLAALQAEDSLDDLLNRADMALIEARKS